MISRWFAVLVSLVFLFQAAPSSAVITTPILEYTLNTADNTTGLPAGAAVTNTGSAGAPGNLTMFSPGNPGTSTNLYSVDGGGVSGALGDRSYNNTVSTAMGNQGTTYAAPNRGPRATNDADNGILNGKTTLTVTGWLKTEAGQTWRGLAQVWAGDAGQFMNIRGGDGTVGHGGKIEFDFRTGSNTFSALVRSSAADWNLDNQWMFFAVTWDGSTGNVGMYHIDGSNTVQSTATSYISSAALGIGALQDTSQMAGPGGNPVVTYGASIGNQGGYALRPFDGWLDNIRVFDAVLNSSDLQFIVDKDLANQPLGTPGDFDGDGDVDGADFVAWQTNYPTAGSATQAQGDADADGDVDGADFAAWQGSFPLSPSSGVAPVPEPNTLILLLAMGAAAFCWRGNFSIRVR